MTVRNQVLGPFTRWAPAAFVLGGIGLLGTTVSGSLYVADVVLSPPWLQMGPLLFGMWFVFVGLLGFYPVVAKQAPRLSRGGVLTSATGWLVWTGTLLAAIVVDLTTQRTIVDPGSWGPPLLAGAFVLALLSFLLFGIASTRSQSPSSIIGFLLLVPVAAFLGQAALLLSKIVSGDVSGALQLALAGITAVTLIAIGYLLRTDTEPAASTESRADPTA